MALALARAIPMQITASKIRMATRSPSLVIQKPFGQLTSTMKIMVGRPSSAHVIAMGSCRKAVTLSGAQALEETIVDAQIGYEWEEGPLAGFSVNLEAYNLTDEPFATENVTADPAVVFPSRHELYGTTYNLMVAKKF